MTNSPNQHHQPNPPNKLSDQKGRIGVVGGAKGGNGDVGELVMLFFAMTMISWPSDIFSWLLPIPGLTHPTLDTVDAGLGL